MAHIETSLVFLFRSSFNPLTAAHCSCDPKGSYKRTRSAFSFLLFHKVFPPPTYRDSPPAPAPGLRPSVFQLPCHCKEPPLLPLSFSPFMFQLFEFFLISSTKHVDRVIKLPKTFSLFMLSSGPRFCDNFLRDVDSPRFPLVRSCNSSDEPLHLGLPAAFFRAFLFLR